MHYVYVVECADGSYYTGYTTDLRRRVAEHNAGDGAKYTRGRTPVELVYRESYGTRSAAMSREYEIKQLPRAQKERLVADDAREPEESRADRTSRRSGDRKTHRASSNRSAERSGDDGGP